MLKLFIIILLLALIKTVNSQWQQSGLSGIEMTAIGIAPTGVMYAASASGFVYKSTNNGNNWFVSSPLLHTPFELDIKSNGYIFLTNFNGIYRSTDEGSSWQLIYGPTTSVNTLEILLNGNLIIGTAAQGPYISTNNGISWILSNTGLSQSVIYLKTNKTNGDIYAGTYYNGVYKSTNGGASWFQSLFLDEYIIALTIPGNGEVYAGAVGGTKIFRSSNNGNSWQQVFTAGTVGYTVTVLQHLPNEDILAGTTSTGLIKTTNNGQKLDTI